jgi:Pyruvate/2-oxoacid:ferredoxin oxidoreductase delta subunit
MSDEEKEYLKTGIKYKDKIQVAHRDSVMEGFEYFFTKYQDKLEGSGRPSMPEIAKQMGARKVLRMMGSLLGYQKRIQKSIAKSYKAIRPYFGDLAPTDFKKTPELWNHLQEFISSKWDDVIIGFTQLPNQLIFKDKFTLFRHALVVLQEMKKDQIDFAPEMEAGKETMRVYTTLGEVVNEISEWLREKGVKSQSVHPLGGLVATPPLAGKAGLGWQGRMGLLITREFGPRQRIAPIFLEHQYFDYTDSTEHRWIEHFCKTCHTCQFECPTEAIQEEKFINIDDVPGIGAMKTCIDREKCFPYFLKTLGCSVCIKVCPFSAGPHVYDKLKGIISNLHPT